MAIPEHKPEWDDNVETRELAQSLDELRREIKALRRELVDAGPSTPPLNEESYRVATQIDLLVNRIIRLYPTKSEYE